jgi:hypothetical protein
VENLIMKSKLLAFAAISVLAVFSPTYSIADEATVTATPAAEAVDRDAVLHRAREAIQRLETACLDHDQSGIAAAVTQDVIAEYALPEPGEYLALDASALDKHCAVATPLAQSKQISNLWVYPTPRADTVFFRYSEDTHTDSIRDARSTQYVGLVEMRGDRIAKIQHTSTSPTELVGVAKICAASLKP